MNESAMVITVMMRTVHLLRNVYLNTGVLPPTQVAGAVSGSRRHGRWTRDERLAARDAELATDRANWQAPIWQGDGRRDAGERWLGLRSSAVSGCRGGSDRPPRPRRRQSRPGRR